MYQNDFIIIISVCLFLTRCLFCLEIKIFRTGSSIIKRYVYRESHVVIQKGYIVNTGLWNDVRDSLSHTHHSNVFPIEHYNKLHCYLSTCTKVYFYRMKNAPKAIIITHSDSGFYLFQINGHKRINVKKSLFL